jgi:hypothetical protein
MSGRALVAYSASSTHVQTTYDYLVSFGKYSGFSTSYVHVTHGACVEFDFNEFDIIFHNYCSRLCFSGYVSDSYRERLRAFQGPKILAVQDEYDRTDTLKAAIKDLGFDIVLTCVPQDSLEYVYPKAEFPGVTFITVFTGYVSDDFEIGRPPPPSLSDRPLLIGYRGRDIGGRYGRLGFDKFEIGRRMKEICDARGIATDIAMDEASRIYGVDWFHYLGRCRAMLGSESGSNVFDFDGAIEARFKAMTAANGGVPPSYAEFLPFVEALDGQIDMGQISPRVFECALMRTPMVLYRGRYSDAIRPDEHYIALDRDFSNVDEVLARLEDIPGLEAMAERAYAHLVASGAFNYRTFFGMVGDVARERLRGERLGVGTRSPAVPVDGLDSFVMNDWSVSERPSRCPDGVDRFAARIAIPEIRLLEAEDARLTREFDRFRATSVQALERRLEAGRHAYAHLAANGDAVDEMKLLPSGEMAEFLAKIDCEDASWRQEWDDILSRIATVQSQPITELPIAINTALVAIRERYKAMSARFMDFQATCQVENQRLQDAFVVFRKALPSSLLRMMTSGRISPAFMVFMLRYVAKGTLGICVAPARRIAHISARSLAGNARFQSMKIRVAVGFPRLIGPGRRVMGLFRSFVRGF